MHELLVRPGAHGEKLRARPLAYRNLFYILAWRDIGVPYKQSLIAITCAILRPFLAMLILRPMPLRLMLTCYLSDA